MHSKKNLPPVRKGTQEIDCFSCRYFYITHDRRFPYGCRRAGFKSKLLPSKEMYANSNLECQVFEEKEKKG